MKILEYLNNMEQAKVVHSRSGGGAGSIIAMDLNCISGEQYSLWIECDWRIENKLSNKIIATSYDNTEAVFGRVAQSVKNLEGKVIEHIELSSFYDLHIKFVDGHCLNVFCILSYDYEFETNWYIACPKQNWVYEITNQFRIKEGKYK